jgi:hypothetical protein
LIVDFILPNATTPSALGIAQDDQRIIAIGLQEVSFN